MALKQVRLKWGVEQRLEFIEFQLFWEGGINRADITGFFGVSVPQASKDLSQYQELARKNVRYDRREKRYFATDAFTPRFLAPDAEDYLFQLAAADAPNATSWLSDPPSADAMPVPHRRVDTAVLRAVVGAVRNQASIDVLYQSMNEKRPDPIWRRITPHAFGSDGFRWHVRAYCHLDDRFKDFLLSRCLDTRLTQPSDVPASTDTCWSDFFNVVLSPNPKLGANQRKVIARDYEMEDDRIEIPVRKALLYYFQKRLRLDVAEALDNPQETPVIVANRDEFDTAIKEASQ